MSYDNQNVVAKQGGQYLQNFHDYSGKFFTSKNLKEIIKTFYFNITLMTFYQQESVPKSVLSFSGMEKRKSTSLIRCPTIKRKTQKPQKSLVSSKSWYTMLLHKQ